jgi:hypothetical protein
MSACGHSDAGRRAVRDLERVARATAIGAVLLMWAGWPSAAADSTNRVGEAAAGGDARVLPPSVDLRPRFEHFGLAARSQGARNTCSVFTTAGTLEFALAVREGRGEPLSAEYLNWACNRTIGNRTEDRGQFFHNLLKAFARYGICPESAMPYQPRFDPQLAPSTAAVARATAIRDEGFEIHWISPWNEVQGLTDAKMRAIREVLAAGWPVAAGSDHSRLLVGYGDDPAEAGGGHFLTRDSGSGSFDRVTYEFVRTKVSDVFWVEARPKADVSAAVPDVAPATPSGN